MAVEVAPGLSELFLPEQCLIDAKLFPRIFCPSSPHLSVSHVFRTNSQFLDQQLLDHGALFFRGFSLHSPHDFTSLVDATGWERIPYIGSAPRTVVAQGVYTANDVDPNVSIPFHHEMAQLTEGWPAKVLLFCEINAAEGGQTPIVVSRKVTERMWQEAPDFMEKLEALGVIYTKVLPAKTDNSWISGQGWPLVFGTSDRKEAERRAMDQYQARVEWLPDESLRTIAGPFKATRNFGGNGQNVWFNKIMAYYTGEPGKDGLDVVFGDGSQLPEDAVEACKRIHEDLCVEIPWQKGDVMVVDNFAVMHARRPYKPPRKVFVTLCR